MKIIRPLNTYPKSMTFKDQNHFEQQLGEYGGWSCTGWKKHCHGLHPTSEQWPIHEDYSPVSAGFLSVLISPKSTRPSNSRFLTLNFTPSRNFTSSNISTPCLSASVLIFLPKSPRLRQKFLPVLELRQHTYWGSFWKAVAEMHGPANDCMPWDFWCVAECKTTANRTDIACPSKIWPPFVTSIGSLQVAG